jgi:hypothetical protein
MSSTISLQNLLTVSNISPKNTPHATTSSEEFSEAVATATSSEASAQQEGSSLLAMPGTLQANAALEGRLLTDQAEATLEAFTANIPGQTLLTLESVLTAEAAASPNTRQVIADTYNQASIDILGLERNFLELIQAVQKEDIPQVRKILGQLSRRRPRAKFSSSAKRKISSDPLERFLEEMESALEVNDLYAAQLTINSFLAHSGESRGNLIAARV